MGERRYSLHIPMGPAKRASSGRASVWLWVGSDPGRTSRVRRKQTRDAAQQATDWLLRKRSLVYGAGSRSGAGGLFTRDAVSMLQSQQAERAGATPFTFAPRPCPPPHNRMYQISRAAGPSPLPDAPSPQYPRICACACTRISFSLARFSQSLQPWAGSPQAGAGGALRRSRDA